MRKTRSSVGNVFKSSLYELRTIKSVSSVHLYYWHTMLIFEFSSRAFSGEMHCLQLTVIVKGQLGVVEAGWSIMEEVIHLCFIMKMFVLCFSIGLVLCSHVSLIQMYGARLGKVETRIDFTSCPQAANRAKLFSEACAAYSLSLFLILVVSDLSLCLSIWLKY